MAVMWNEFYTQNTLVNLVVALLVATGFVVVGKALKGFLKARAQRENAPEGLRWVGSLAGALKDVFLLVLGLYIGLRWLVLPDGWMPLMGQVFSVALFVQLGLIVAAGLSFGLDRYRQQKEREQDMAHVAALNMIELAAKCAVWLVVFLLMVDNLGYDVTALVAGLGVGGIAVALAVQNILGDLFASLSIVLDKPFVVGDFIIVGDFLGAVEHIGLKTTRVRSLSGEQLIFANSDLLGSRIRNFKRMRERRVVFQLGVTYDTRPEKLERIPEIIRSIVEAQSPVRFDRSHFQKYGDFALIFETVYWVLEADYQVYMRIHQAINLALYRAFEEEGIAFAYPTQTLYLKHDSSLASKD